MILYILKSASCLALLLFFYHLILEKEKMHNFNRFYLLIGVIVSLIIPFATLTVAVPAISTLQITPFEPTFIVEETSPILVEETIDHTKYILSIYAIISCLLFFRFVRNLFKIIQKIRLHANIKLKKASLVLVDNPILPHTFWNFIFINKTDYKNGKIEEELFTHELTHVTQKHTIDVLLIEFLQAIFWINPLFIFLKKAMQLNHEFLADENVINQHKNTFHYKHILVNKAAWNNEYYLASNLNYSLTKKRLKMMTTQSSKTKIWLKKLAVIPLLAGFIFLFAERVEAQEIIEEVKPKNSNEILIFLKKDKKLKINNVILILSDLKDEIDQKITKINNAYIVLEAEANSNLKKQFIEEIRNELNKSGIYQISFKNFILSPNSDLIKLKGEREINEIRKNQVEEVVEEKTKKASLERYNKINKKYESFRKEKPHFVKSSKEKQNELNEMFSFMGRIYFELSKEDKKKTKRPIHPDYPYIRLIKNNKVFYKLRKDLTEEDKLLIPPPPPMRNASKEEIKKNKKVYKNWKKRTGNDFAPPPPPKKKEENNDEKKENSFTEKLKKLNAKEKLRGENNNEIEFTNRNNQANNSIYVVKSPQNIYKFRESTGLTEEQRIKLTKDKKYFIDDKELTYDDFMKIESKNIKSVSVLSNRIYVVTKTGKDPKINTQKSKKQLPSSFIRKANEKENFVFNSVEFVKSEKESKLNDVEKKQFLLRKTIIQATTLNEKKFNFKIDGKESKINGVYKYILDNPLCEISTKKDKKNILTLNIDKFKETKMSNHDLQNVYSKVFENIK